MLPEVSGLDRTFHYVVPEGWVAGDAGDLARGAVPPGTMVRVPLGGRRVGGWVVEADITPDPGVSLRPLAKITGVGPPDEVVDLARWAAHRWAGRLAPVLRAASPPRAVRRIGARRPLERTLPPVPDEVADVFAGGVSTVRLPPGADRFGYALAAARLGPSIIAVPTQAEARRLAALLRRAGATVALLPDDWAASAGGACTVGARNACWAPVPDPAAVVVLDEHDDRYHNERNPTWNTRDVLLERARRAGAPAVLVSPCPTLEALRAGELVTPSRAAERRGWPIVEIVDRREEDPVRSGLYSEALVAHLRSDESVVCVVNRKGRARLVVCRRCGTTAGCARCGAAVVLADAEVLRCERCGEERPVVCLDCGSITLAARRIGVTRAREELEHLVGEPVGEVTGSGSKDHGVPSERVVVGTEAALHRVTHTDVVAFLDLDQELLAPRYRAAEQALALLALAGRRVGGRRRNGRLLLQTRLVDHEVVRAAVSADPDLVATAEAARRRVLRLPPERALALVTGAGAERFALALEALGAEVRGDDTQWLVAAADADELADLLAAAERPEERIRVEVDPLRV
ncbi:MAG: hypothetical protein S0880_07960 [Actinomycetota bacterium]|nr:hypothetical protein [Actinomycetota bacterium]